MAENPVSAESDLRDILSEELSQIGNDRTSQVGSMRERLQAYRYEQRMREVKQVASWRRRSLVLLGRLLTLTLLAVSLVQFPFGDFQEALGKSLEKSLDAFGIDVDLVD